MYHSKAQIEASEHILVIPPAPYWRACHPPVKVAEGHPGVKFQDLKSAEKLYGTANRQPRRISIFNTELQAQRHTGMGRVAERYSVSGKPEKAKVDPAKSISISKDGLVRLVEQTMARILRGFVAPTPTTGSREGVQALRTEMNDNINKVQT